MVGGCDHVLVVGLDDPYVEAATTLQRGQTITRCQRWVGRSRALDESIERHR
jgi:hypothetical protein